MVTVTNVFAARSARTSGVSGQRWLPSTTVSVPIAAMVSWNGTHAVIIRSELQVAQ